MAGPGSNLSHGSRRDTSTFEGQPLFRYAFATNNFHMGRTDDTDSNMDAVPTESASAAAAAAAAKRLKACIPCTNAKTKCTPFGNLNNLCERCQRLGKSCNYAEATVRPKKNRTSSRKQLEEKVDSLVNLLQTIQPGAKVSLPSSDNSPPSTHEPFSNLTQSASTGNASTFMPNCDGVEEPVQPKDYTVIEALPLETTNRLFSYYCTECAPEFPFVTFAPSETVSTMRLNRPLTLKALLAVSLHADANLQRKASLEVSETIKFRMMSRKSYSFDLLQAILVHVAWYQYAFRGRHQEFFIMVQFAITLTHELGIDKNPGNKKMDLTIKELRPASMEGIKYEQWRALLGTCYVAAVFSGAFRKPRLMQYTKYMEKCRQRLLESIEMQTDFAVDIIIGIQNVCLDVNDTFNLYDYENGDVSGDLAIKSLVSGYMNELRSIEEKAHARRNGPLTANEQRHLGYARVYVHEVTIHKELWSSPESAAISPTRITLGWNGLELAKKLLSSYAHLPGDDFYKLTTAPWTQMLYSLIMLNKFVALDNAEQPTDPSATPGQWDTQLAYKEAEVQRLGGMVVEKLAARSFDDRLWDGNHSIIWALSWIIRNLIKGHRQWCIGDVDAPPLDHDSNTVQSVSVGASTGSTPGTSTDGMNLSAGTGYATAFPDVTFGNTAAEWPEGLFQNFVWDAMMNDMNTLPFT